jgi:hypothetical protein
MRLLPKAALIAFTAAGCAPALSTMQPAHVAKRNHVLAQIGMDVSVPTGTIARVINAGQTLAETAEKRELTDAEVGTLYQAGTGLVLNPPSATPHIRIGFSVVDNLEINLRYATSSVRLGGRYQFLNKEKHGIDASVGLGAGYFVFDLPLSGLPVLKLDDFSRFEIDLPLLFGTQGSWYRVWGGPRFGTELTLELPEVAGIAAARKELASLGGNGFYVGAQGGVAVGYKYVFLGIELTMVQLIMRGDLTVAGKPMNALNMDSFIIYPSIGLMGEF